LFRCGDIEKTMYGTTYVLAGVREIMGIEHYTTNDLWGVF